MIAKDLASVNPFKCCINGNRLFALSALCADGGEVGGTLYLHKTAKPVEDEKRGVSGGLKYYSPQGGVTGRRNTVITKYLSTEKKPTLMEGGELEREGVEERK